MKFPLPPAIAELFAARNKVRAHYGAVLKAAEEEVTLDFTFDGNFVGDLAQAIAVEMFGVKLTPAKKLEGIDGFAPDGRSVQIKATGRALGPAFRMTKVRADHLLFLNIDFEAESGEVVFNGPEHLVIARMPEEWTGQRSLRMAQMRRLDGEVDDADRLAVLG